jgi:hypothetical protein
MTSAPNRHHKPSLIITWNSVFLANLVYCATLGSQLCVCARAHRCVCICGCWCACMRARLCARWHEPGVSFCMLCELGCRTRAAHPAPKATRASCAVGRCMTARAAQIARMHSLASLFSRTQATYAYAGHAHIACMHARTHAAASYATNYAADGGAHRAGRQRKDGDCCARNR